MAFDPGKVKNFIKGKSEVSVPEIQAGLSLGYADAKRAMELLVSMNLVQFDSGVSYKVLVKPHKEETFNPFTGENVESDDPEMLETLAIERARLEARRESIRRIMEKDSKPVMEERVEYKEEDDADAFDSDEIEEFLADLDLDVDDEPDIKDDVDDDLAEISKILYGRDSDVEEDIKCECDGTEDDAYINGLKFFIEKKAASVSMLQRQFLIGYIKSCKIMNWMEKNGYVTSPGDGKPRKVMVTEKQFQKIAKLFANRPRPATEEPQGIFSVADVGIMTLNRSLNGALKAEKKDDLYRFTLSDDGDDCVNKIVAKYVGTKLRFTDDGAILGAFYNDGEIIREAIGDIIAEYGVCREENSLYIEVESDKGALCFMHLYAAMERVRHFIREADAIEDKESAEAFGWYESLAEVMRADRDGTRQSIISAVSEKMNEGKQKKNFRDVFCYTYIRKTLEEMTDEEYELCLEALLEDDTDGEGEE